MPQIKAFIIHLDRAEARLPQVEELINTLPFDSEIISAVDGRDLSPNTIQSYYQRKLYKPTYPFELSNNEIACFLSHRKAWAAIVEQGLDGGFVIEDDVALTPEFDAAIALAYEFMTPQSFIRFPFREREHGLVMTKTKRCRLIAPLPVGLGQVAQLVGYEAAQKLLVATRQFDRPVDTMMQMFWETGVCPLSVLPGGVREVSNKLGGSTIKKQRTFPERLQREILRPIYRMRIAAQSQRRKP